MTVISTPNLSVKVATALDVITTLVAGELGYVFSVPAYHPVIVGYAVGVSFVLFKWKDEITCKLLNLTAPLQNRNRYNYAQKAPLFGTHRKQSFLAEPRTKFARLPKNFQFFVHYDKIMMQNLKFKVHMLKSIFKKNAAREKPKDIYLLFESRNYN